MRQPWAAASLATPYGRLSWSERWYRAGMWLIWVAETTSWLCVATQQPQARGWVVWHSVMHSDSMHGPQHSLCAPRMAMAVHSATSAPSRVPAHPVPCHSRPAVVAGVEVGDRVIHGHPRPGRPEAVRA